MKNVKWYWSWGILVIYKDRFDCELLLQVEYVAASSWRSDMEVSGQYIEINNSLTKKVYGVAETFYMQSLHALSSKSPRRLIWDINHCFWISGYIWAGRFPSQPTALIGLSFVFDWILSSQLWQKIKNLELYIILKLISNHS